MKITQIKETCLYVEDLERTYKFYHGLLKFPMISRVEGRHIFFRAGSSVLLCFIAEATAVDEKLPPHHGSGMLHLAFEVKRGDYESTKKRILECGIQITHEETWRDRVRSFYFDDPDGHVLEIVPEGMWEG